MGLYASSLSCVALRGAASTAEVAARVRAAAARTEAGRWIIGRGYDLNLFAPGDAPHARVLDEATADHPVFLTSHDVHGCWVSSSALRRAHVERGVQAPPGGIIERDQSGEPTGIMYEGAVRLVEAVLPKRTLEQMKDDLAVAQADFLRRGIRFVQDLDPDTEEGWRALDDEGKLEMCVATAVPQRELRRAIREGRRSGEGSGRLKLGGVKFFLDGALGSRTAAMLEPYADRPGWSGTLLIPPDRLREELRLCRDAGLKPLVHAIGDRAVRVVLDAILARRARSRRASSRASSTRRRSPTPTSTASPRRARSPRCSRTTSGPTSTSRCPALGERSRLVFRCGSLLRARREAGLRHRRAGRGSRPDARRHARLRAPPPRPRRAAFHPEEAISRADALAAATSIAQAELGF